ncbi:LppU/SCO3897 family protein [Kitasatospora paranensis]|uniref:Uncharacterized protein n=1 Tax=Kitasatospora paranensis TaxID=258053 RepID=A0ABW2FWJ9_9ACTN
MPQPGTVPPPPAYGYPGPPQPPVPQQAYGGPGMPASPPKSRRGLRFWAQMGVLALGAVVLVVALFSDTAPGSKVGDCLHRSTTTTKVTDVSCSDPQANYKVVKRVNNSLTSSCTGTPGVTATYRGSYGRRLHRKHYVLCLAPYSPAGAPGAGASPKKF